VDRAAVKFRLPLGDLFVQVPSATEAIVVSRLAVEHVVVELRTPQGELLSVATYRDLPALMGREAPVVWARGAGGEPVHVTAHTGTPLTDLWWDGVLGHVLARHRDETVDLSMPMPDPSDTISEGMEYLGSYNSIPAYMRAMLEPEVTPGCAWILDHLDYQAVQRQWESDGSRLMIERGHMYRLLASGPEGDPPGPWMPTRGD